MENGFNFYKYYNYLKNFLYINYLHKSVEDIVQDTWFLIQGSGSKLLTSSFVHRQKSASMPGSILIDVQTLQ